MDYILAEMGDTFETEAFILSPLPSLLSPSFLIFFGKCATLLNPHLSVSSSFMTAKVLVHRHRATCKQFYEQLHRFSLGVRWGAYRGWENLRARKHLEDLGVDGTVNIKMDFQETGLGGELDWTGSCEECNEPAGSVKIRWIPWPTEELLDSQVGLISMELVFHTEIRLDCSNQWMGNLAHLEGWDTNALLRQA